MIAIADIETIQEIYEHLDDVWKPCLQIHARQSVTSTNTVVKELASQGVEEGYVLLAQEQTKGKGRQGRSFYSPSQTGLYMSLLLRPSMMIEEALSITTMAAVAMARAVEAETGISLQIKWVNDLYYLGRKVCGILTETAMNPNDGHYLDYAVLGVGLNLEKPENGFPEELDGIVSALYPHGDMPSGAKTRISAAFLNEFMKLYRYEDFSSVLSEYRDRSVLIGEEVVLISETGQPTVRVLDIDEHAALVVQYPDGVVRAIQAGEVRVRLK
ncbi:MAG: biotin--[acetyl-CoA-carboxylase] ligase [Lachnospiraceae bacterium]